MRMRAPFSATLALVDAEGFPRGTDGAHGVTWRVATATDHYAPILPPSPSGVKFDSRLGLLMFRGTRLWGRGRLDRSADDVLDDDHVLEHQPREAATALDGDVSDRTVVAPVASG